MDGKWVRNAWYVAGWSHELAAGRIEARTVIEQPLALYRRGDGSVVVLEDRCCHRFAPLSMGRLEQDDLRCMYHGLLFDAGGKVAQIPGQDLVPARARVRAYPVVVRHSWIWVWMGDVEAADPALIPPAVGFDDPDYILGCGFLDYQAEARLINDNLLDFSHLTYVHAASFGAGPEFAASQPKVTPLERGVRVERWLENTHGSGNRKSEQLIDGWSSYDFLLPGVLLMWSANYPAGTAKRLNYAPPPMVEAIAGLNFTSQAVTPLTDKTSRYFFSWGPHRKFGDEAMRDHMMGIAGMAFAEDKAMIEAQQKVIDTTPAQDVMPTAHDRGVTLFNRLVEKLADAATIELREAVG